MTMERFSYARATTVEEAVEALDEGYRPLAGGTDLVGLMKKGLVAPEGLISLRSIPGLQGMAREEEGWRIGALTTLSTLAELNGPQELAMLSQAAGGSASPQLRHAATIGGNLLQRPRCWYFRNPLTRCWLKGGDRCFAAAGENGFHAILGGGPCYVVHPSDPAVALLALGAQVEIDGPEGRHHVDMADFYTGLRQGAGAEPHASWTALGVDELVRSLFVPRQPGDGWGVYVKVAERAAWDFALVSGAVWVGLEDGLVRDARVVLGGVAPAPWRAMEAEEALLGDRLTPETVREAAAASAAGARPLSENGYKVWLAEGVVREALWRLRSMAG
jgi:xanthine dehydrogenase YagS FAD-binding subunit